MLCKDSIGKKINYNLKNIETKNCSGMTIVESSSFFPYDWFHHVEMIESKPNSFWKEKFKSSLAVTYYGSSSRGPNNPHGTPFPKVLRPNFYGKNKPALAYLGPKECPVSFYSVKKF